MVGQTINDRNLKVLMIVLSVSFGLGIVIVGILNFALWRISDPIDFMLSLYFIAFGLVGTICEFPIPKFATYFSFLKGYFGKGCYFIL